MTDTDRNNTISLQRFAADLVEATREYIYIRPEDGLIIMRPNRMNFLNETATLMLQMLYGRDEGPDVEDVVRTVAGRYGVDEERVRADLRNLLISVSALLNDNLCAAPSVRQTAYGSHRRELPVLSEIALTYRCQNRCTFCYADAPERGAEVPEMSTDEVKVIIDRIYDEAHCPTVSFTGGEPTLRDDLPELVAYARNKGMRVNLITNGLRCADADYVQSLADSGLHSAQVSIEGAAQRYTTPSHAMPARGNARWPLCAICAPQEFTRTPTPPSAAATGNICRSWWTLSRRTSNPNTFP